MVGNGAENWPLSEIRVWNGVAIAIARLYAIYARSLGHQGQSADVADDSSSMDNRGPGLA